MYMHYLFDTLLSSLNASQVEGPIQQHIVGMTQWGVDYSFDCTGNTEVTHHGHLQNRNQSSMTWTLG